jgi:uncharacterized membrane protein
MLYLLALLIGVVTGLRVMTAAAAIGWAVHLGWLPLAGTWLSFLGHPVVPWILTALALVELVGDQLPKTPSRTVPVQFGARLLFGAVCGGAIGLAHGFTVVGAIAGVVGAVIGTLGGREFRRKLAASFGKDPPAAFIEDAVAIGAAVLIVLALR